MYNNKKLVDLKHKITKPQRFQKQTYISLRSAGRREKHLQPARTGRDVTPRVLRAPALRERDPHRPGVHGAYVGERHGRRGAGGVEDAEAVAGSHAPYQQGLGSRGVQRRRAHEHRLCAAVVQPHSVRL